MKPRDLTNLREYHKNPQIAELNAVARQNKKEPLISKSLSWPAGIEVGKWINWEVSTNKSKKVVWVAKKGKVIAVFRRYMVVDLGKYKETITLVDVHLGLVRFV